MLNKGTVDLRNTDCSLRDIAMNQTVGSNLKQMEVSFELNKLDRSRKNAFNRYLPSPDILDHKRLVTESGVGNYFVLNGQFDKL